MTERIEVRRFTKVALAGIVAAVLLNAPGAQAVAQSPAIVQQVTAKAYVYEPANLTGSAPLIVLLHGAGGDAREFINQFKRDAGERGVILLSIQSDGRTWEQRAPMEGERDVVDVKAAIDALVLGTEIDRKRTTIMGFSDGASYALSIGMAYPDLFHSIVAFSPGFAFAPRNPDTRQRIFIAHSRRDPILPAANVRNMIKGLGSAGYSPEVHWFNGGHEIDPQLKKAAFDFALAP